jgi:ATP-dependent helicase/DNAse subunit B
MRRTSILAVLFCSLSGAQLPREVGQIPRDDQPRMKRSQINEMLKDDHKKSIEDAGTLMELAEELKIELEKKDPSVLSLTAIKKTEEIEKIAKRIRSRMKRY